MGILRKGINDLQSNYPEIACEWDYDENRKLHIEDNKHPLTPSDVACGSKRKVAWECSKHGSYMQSPSHRVYMKTGCPKCAQIRTSSFAEKHPELLKYWDYDANINDGNVPSSPDDISQSSTIKVYWKCDVCGNAWFEAPNDLLKKNNPCLNCYKNNVKNRKVTQARKYVLIKYVNDAVTMNSIIIEYWDYEKNYREYLGNRKKPIDPYCVHYESSKVFYFNCSQCGHKWHTAMRSVMKYINEHRIPCQCCRTVMESKYGSVNNYECNIDWDYDANMKEHMKNPLFPATPNMAAAASSLDLHWKCHKCGHKWTIGARRRCIDGSQCLHCSHMINGTLKDANPDFISEWDYEKNMAEHLKNDEWPATPNDVSAKSNLYKIWWKCKRNHSWQATVNSRNRTDITHPKHRGCPYCNQMYKGVSNTEEALRNYIIHTYFNDDRSICIFNDRKLLKGKEIDLLISKCNLAIEFNGNYYHSDENIRHRTKGKNSSYEYHKKKYDLCINAGILLIFIWEDDWFNRNDEVKFALDCLFSQIMKSYDANNQNVNINEILIPDILNKFSSERLENDDTHYRL